MKARFLTISMCCMVLLAVFAWGGCSDSDTEGSLAEQSSEPEVSRETSIACDAARAPGSFTGMEVGGALASTCTADSDCVDGNNGRCTQICGGAGCSDQCTYNTCLEDADCGGFVCACGGGGNSDNNVCTRVGNCTRNADCGEGGFCSPSGPSQCGDDDVVGYFCHTPDDACTNDSDCDEVDGLEQWCVYRQDEERWACVGPAICA